MNNSIPKLLNFTKHRFDYSFKFIYDWASIIIYYYYQNLTGLFFYVNLLIRVKLLLYCFISFSDFFPTFVIRQRDYSNEACLLW